MKNIPKSIYLNFGFDKEEVDRDADFNDMAEISWSTERMNDQDIEYQLSERQTTPKKQIPTNALVSFSFLSGCKKNNMKRFIVKLISRVFYEKGTHLGKRCSGHKCYPDGSKCYGCSDCAVANER